MVSQAKGGCSECGSFAHTKMYHKPKKPLKRTAIKKKLPVFGEIGKGLRQGGLVTPVTKKRKKPVESRSRLVKKLDSVFSQYIRLKDAVDGLATCVTCGTMADWKTMQCGHYESRGHLPTRWDEENCHVQDYRCNVAMKGNYTSYARYMVNKYGAEKLEELHEQATSGKKITTPEIREMIELYKNKVKELL